MRRNRMEQLDGVLEAIRKGEHPYDYLEEQGYVVPMQALSDLKTWARKNAPEKYEQLPSTLRGLKLTRKSIPVNVREEPAPDLKAGESLPVKLPQKDIETVFFGGKPYEKAENADQNAPNTEQKTGDHVSAEDYRKMSGNIREPEKRPQTCCASSTRKGVEVPDELPVCAVKSRVKGEWHLSCVEGCVHLIWEDRITHEERSLGLPADDWKKLASEIPVMLKQLGLAN